jgi:hypothetical protein
MGTQLPFWQLQHLTDEELLANLRRAVRGARALTAESIAHLAEVEERRLHLRAAYSSLFTYCTSALGFSEDEACRRIEVARLAKRFPQIFPLLAQGQLSLSVVALLKPHITPDNASELISGVQGKSVLRAREYLAARFPIPDVASSVRKLPEPRPPAPVSVVQTNLTLPAVIETKPAAPAVRASTPSTNPISATEPPADPLRVSVRPNTSRQDDPKHNATLTPLSADRYAIRFTATGELKRKLEQARELLRHAHPGGDLAPVVERALDLLLDQLMKKRFGRTQRKPTNAAGHSASMPNDRPHSATSPAAPGERTRKPSARSHISNTARRIVFERDGGQCTWTDATGRRCESRDWLQIDHRDPFARGGSDDPENLRLLCQAHNRLHAEQAYGKAHVERAIGRARRRCADRCSARVRNSTFATPATPSQTAAI